MLFCCPTLKNLGACGKTRGIWPLVPWKIGTLLVSVDFPAVHIPVVSGIAVCLTVCGVVQSVSLIPV